MGMKTRQARLSLNAKLKLRYPHKVATRAQLLPGHGSTLRLMNEYTLYLYQNRHHALQHRHTAFSVQTHLGVPNSDSQLIYPDTPNI